MAQSGILAEGGSSLAEISRSTAFDSRYISEGMWFDSGWSDSSGTSADVRGREGRSDAGPPPRPVRGVASDPRPSEADRRRRGGGDEGSGQRRPSPVSSSPVTEDSSSWIGRDLVWEEELPDAETRGEKGAGGGGGETEPSSSLLYSLPPFSRLLPSRRRCRSSEGTSSSLSGSTGDDHGQGKARHPLLLLVEDAARGPFGEEMTLTAELSSLFSSFSSFDMDDGILRIPQEDTDSIELELRSLPEAERTLREDLERAQEEEEGRLGIWQERQKKTVSVATVGTQTEPLRGNEDWDSKELLPNSPGGGRCPSSWTWCGAVARR